ncbi:MAG: GWxTD domain-containing protein [Acidobacteria bacterium]|nr:GWxTD domain-containing protein [Acidobacteriota bacterium]
MIWFPGEMEYRNPPRRVSTPQGLLVASWILLLTVGFAAYGAAPAEIDWDSPSREWYQGPVRYLLSTDEEKAYRALETEGERRKFIEDFWARRDEDASTPVNEFELRYKNRVREANDLFRDAPYPGWKTDRGKFYVLIGPPDEIRQDHFTGRRGKEIFYTIWIYHEPRFPGMERDTQVRLVRDDSGQYEATDRLALDRIERYFGTPLNLALQASAAQRPPEPRELLDTIAAARPDKDSKRFHTRYDFFLAADGSTSVVLTLGIRRSDPEPDWRVYARLSNGAASFDLAGVDSFRTSPEGSDVDGFRLYQGRISLPPGLYSTFFGIQNVATQELFSLSERVTVPDFREGTFAISGITLAARLEPAPNPESDPPFLVGRLLIIPKMEAVYQTGTELAYYFQVYHPGKDPTTGDASLDLTYQFVQAASLQKTGEPAYKSLGKPLFFENQAGLVHGYAFPLTGWPAGEFKLQITVKDRVTGRSSQAEARFSVR